MKERIHHYFSHGYYFKKEVKDQIRIVILITLGFTIAFTWRQTLFDITQSFVQKLTHISNSNYSSILTSVFITIVSLIIIYIASNFLKEGQD